MANKGFPDRGHRFADTGPHDLGKRRKTDNEVDRIAGMTSVEEQVNKGGWTRVEAPMSDDGSYNQKYASPFQGGCAGEDSDHDVAAYPGRSTPKSGTTF